MLIITNKLSDICFYELMDVYREGNIANGAERYPMYSPQQQLLLAEQDFYQFLKEIFFSQENAVYAIWQAGGGYAAALRLEPYCDGLLLSALETRPDARRRGYGTILMNSVIKYLSEQGSGKLYSHIGKHNEASLALHKRCGFGKILDYAVYLDGSVTNYSYTFLLNY